MKSNLRDIPVPNQIVGEMKMYGPDGIYRTERVTAHTPSGRDITIRQVVDFVRHGVDWPRHGETVIIWTPDASSCRYRMDFAHFEATETDDFGDVLKGQFLACETGEELVCIAWKSVGVEPEWLRRIFYNEENTAAGHQASAADQSELEN